MTQPIIDELIAGTYPDPDGGPNLRVETQSIAIEKSLAGHEADLIRPLGLGNVLAVVSDKTTHKVMGERIETVLKGKAEIVSVVLPEHPHADLETAETIRKATSRADALIAIGSGTINDLCKYASALDKKPYVVFGTAPSMNGYTSLNAAITVKGHKKSLAAQVPKGAFFDLSILTAAPLRMIRSGLGDSLCRPTAQADWLLSHFLFDTPYREMPFVLLASDEPELFANTEALIKGDIKAMERLVRTLLLSGFGTAICGNSMPASQAEHLISHYMDMRFEKDHVFAFHGEQIGVTTLAMAKMQSHFLEGPAPMVKEDKRTESEFIAHFGKELGPSCWKDYEQKRMTREKAASVNDRFSKKWDEIRQKILKITLPVEKLTEALRKMQAPLSYQDLQWKRGPYEEAILHAREIRNRYTFLDLAADSTGLPTLLPKMI